MTNYILTIASIATLIVSVSHAGQAPEPVTVDPAKLAEYEHFLRTTGAPTLISMVETDFARMLHHKNARMIALTAAIQESAKAKGKSVSEEVNTCLERSEAGSYSDESELCNEVRKKSLDIGEIVYASKTKALYRKMRREHMPKYEIKQLITPEMLEQWMLLKVTPSTQVK